MSEEPNPGSRLCTACGLCCEGAIHEAAVLDDDELADAARHGLPLKPGDRLRFALPCPKLEGAVCTIYGDRPRVCGRYRCGLLQRFEAGEVSAEAGLAHVAEAKRLAADFSAVARTVLPHSRDIAMGSEQAGTSVTLTAIALQLYLDRHFRNERDGRILRSDAIGAARQAEME